MRRGGPVVALLCLTLACTSAPEPPAQTAAAPDTPAGSPGAPDRIAVWIDTDPSVMPGGHEVDDGLALIQAFHSPELDVRGVSAVFGNAELATTARIAEEIVDRFGPDRLQAWAGADGPARLGEQTEATRALISALDQAPMTILALGPVTNVASVLLLRPELRSQIQEIVVVAGRRPGDQFRVGTGGAPLRDLNFELDAPAMQVLLDSGVLLTLAPFEISSKVMLTGEHLARLEAGGEAARWLAGPVRDWLDRWRTSFGASGFHPFDTLAVAYLTSPDWLTCEDVPSQIVTAQDDVEPGREKPYFHVSADLRTSFIVRYCHDVDAAFTDDLLTRLVE